MGPTAHVLWVVYPWRRPSAWPWSPWGRRHGFGVFIIPMSEEFGWNRSTSHSPRRSGRWSAVSVSPFWGVCTTSLGGKAHLGEPAGHGWVYDAPRLDQPPHLSHSHLWRGHVHRPGRQFGDHHLSPALQVVSPPPGHCHVPQCLWSVLGWTAPGALYGLSYRPRRLARDLGRVGSDDLILVLPLAFFLLKDDPAEMGLLPTVRRSRWTRARPGRLARVPWRSTPGAIYSFRSRPMWQLCGGYFVCGYYRPRVPRPPQRRRLPITQAAQGQPPPSGGQRWLRQAAATGRW